MTIYWTDLHSNLHHSDLEQRDRWLEHARKTLDFWAIAYYPYAVQALDNGLRTEGLIAQSEIHEDWAKLADLANQATHDGFPVFLGYEWQGLGWDGDHNVFFKDQGQPAFPDRYAELKELVQPQVAMAIPHHVAYHQGFRGKNWSTHDPGFSPFAEIYSSHGSSEDDPVALPMERHIHMGPRTGQTSVQAGLRLGFPMGLMASGDNHQCPAVYAYGAMGVHAAACTKDALWEAMMKRQVYGVSRDRIALDVRVDHALMGSQLDQSNGRQLHIRADGTDRFDRVEVVTDRGRLALLSPSGQVSDPLEDGVTIRFELGWGPDRRVFAECVTQTWKGTLEVDGTIVSVTPCFNHFDQSVSHTGPSTLDFSLISTKQNPNDRWMGVSPDLQEGFIVRLKAKPDALVTLTVNGHQWIHRVEELMNRSYLHPFLAKSRQLIADRYGDKVLKRKDAWWHNAAKVKIHRAWTGAETHFEHTLTLPKGLAYVRVNVFQVNGSIAWSSPIFFEEVAHENA
jgi:hypothetical protein